MTDFIGPYRVTWTDDETVIVKININDTLKEIKDYGHQAPPEFQAFVALFEKICDGMKWNKLEK